MEGRLLLLSPLDLFAGDLLTVVRLLGAAFADAVVFAAFAGLDLPVAGWAALTGVPDFPVASLDGAPDLLFANVSRLDAVAMSDSMLGDRMRPGTNGNRGRTSKITGTRPVRAPTYPAIRVPFTL